MGTDGTRSNRSRRLLVMKLLAVCLSTLLALGLCEIALRIFWHNSYRGDSTMHLVRLNIQPANRDYLIDRAVIDPEHPTVRMRTDARSYILPSFQHEHPVATVAFLGGSTTECSAVREELRFPALVADLLAERGLDVNVLNAGTAGSTVHDSLNALLNHVEQDDPDVAVMMHATNDFGVLAAKGDYASRAGRTMNAGDQVLWLKQKLTRHVYLAAFCRKILAERGARYKLPDEIAWRNSQLEGLPYDDYRRRVRAFVALCRVFDIRPVLMTQPLASMTNELTPAWANLGAQDRFNAVVREVGAEEGVPVIDLARHLVEDVPGWDEPMNVFFDGMHVTDHGSQVYAAYIAEKLAPIVEELARQRAAP